jgi:hypothetical protein
MKKCEMGNAKWNMTGWEILAMRKALPAIVSWLYLRERGAAVPAAIESPQP